MVLHEHGDARDGTYGVIVYATWSEGVYGRSLDVVYMINSRWNTEQNMGIKKALGLLGGISIPYNTARYP